MNLTCRLAPGSAEVRRRDRSSPVSSKSGVSRCVQCCRGWRIREGSLNFRNTQQVATACGTHGTRQCAKIFASRVCFVRVQSNVRFQQRTAAHSSAPFGSLILCAQDNLSAGSWEALEEGAQCMERKCICACTAKAGTVMSPSAPCTGPHDLHCADALPNSPAPCTL